MLYNLIRFVDCSQIICLDCCTHTSIHKMVSERDKHWRAENEIRHPTMRKQIRMRNEKIGRRKKKENPKSKLKFHNNPWNTLSYALDISCLNFCFCFLFFVLFLFGMLPIHSMNRWNFSLCFASPPPDLYNKCMRRHRIRVLAFTYILFNFIFVLFELIVVYVIVECWILNMLFVIRVYTFYDTQTLVCII